MRTSTLLAVLAALMLLVACAAPVFGQSSSSSTGESSSSSAATIIASSSSSTGSSGNATAASSSAASVSSSSSGASAGTSFVLLTFPNFNDTDANKAAYEAELKSEISRALGISQDSVTFSLWFANPQVANAYSNIVTIGVANAATLLNNVKSSYTLLNQATISSSTNQPGAASTLSFGFAAVAVVLAALLL